MQTYADIKAQIDILQAEAERLREAEKAGVIGRIKEAIDAYGITAADLGLSGGGRRRAASGKSSRELAGRGAAKGLQVGVAKYRDPESGKTWTGRGKPPTWILGKDRASMLIDGASASFGESTSSPAEAASGRKGRGRAKAAKKQTVGVPKYRDAATGKTWTGRGKPPTWIAGAKNRDDYLISPASA